jgi:hypothetical protein
LTGQREGPELSLPRSYEFWCNQGISSIDQSYLVTKLFFLIRQGSSTYILLARTELSGCN